MKAKKVMMTVLAAVSVLSMSANVMAAGSITNEKRNVHVNSAGIRCNCTGTGKRPTAI